MDKKVTTELNDAFVETLKASLEVRGELLEDAMSGWKKTMTAYRKSLQVNILFYFIFYLLGMAAGILFFAM